MTKTIGIKTMKRQVDIMEKVISLPCIHFEDDERELAWSFIAFLRDTQEEIERYGHVTLTGMIDD